MSFNNHLIQIMEDHGFSIVGSVDIYNPKFQRFRSRNSRQKDIFVKIHGHCEGATFGDWHDKDNFITWWAKSLKQATINERRDYEVRRIAERQNIEREQMRMTLKCRRFFYKTKDAAEIHPYTVKKRIIAYYARSCRNIIVLPIRDIDYEIQSLQFIYQNGFKQFKRGAPTKGGMIWLCELLPEDYRGVIRLCEGWSTGCTIKEITGQPVICALNAYNMPVVAKDLRQKYLHATIKICADNDQFGAENTGYIYALEASSLCRGIIYYPTFENINIDSKPTDFNDLFILAGTSSVEKQLVKIRQ